MQKYGARLRVARRLGGGFNPEFTIRDQETKCNIKMPPGQHGSRKRHVTDYGLQLAEKQKLRAMYGVLERQFRNLYKKASQKKGVVGINLLALLETRLDNIVFRMGFASTRREARQLVSHRAICVNGSVTNIPSYQVKEGDVISVRENKRQQERVQDAMKRADEKGLTDWVQVDAKNYSGSLKRTPERDDLPSDIDVSLVVELYSK